MGSPDAITSLHLFEGSIDIFKSFAVSDDYVAETKKRKLVLGP